MHDEKYGHDEERRTHPRKPMHSLTYVRLGQENGGIIIDLSEQGIAVRAAMPIHEEILVLLFQLEGSKDWIQTRGRVVWQKDASKSAGIQFVDVSDTMRNVIENWIADGEPQGQRKINSAARSRSEYFSDDSARVVSASPGRDVATEHERIARSSLATFTSAIQPTRAFVSKSIDPRAVVPFAERTVEPPGTEIFASPERLMEEARPANATGRRKWRTAILIGFLMCLSGLFGWLVGRGTPNWLRRTSYAQVPENSDRAAKAPMEIPNTANQDIGNPPPAVAPTQNSQIEEGIEEGIAEGVEEGWVFLGQLTPDLSWAPDQPRYVRDVQWPINKGDHITLSHDVWVHEGSSPRQPVVGRLHLGESTLVEDVNLSRAKEGGYFAWVKVGQKSAP
jgi:hypothetical protein